MLQTVSVRSKVNSRFAGKRSFPRSSPLRRLPLPVPVGPVPRSLRMYGPPHPAPMTIEVQFGSGPKFLLLSSAPLQTALWQRRSEPVKALRCASTADAAPAAAWTEPSAPLPRRKSHEAGALNKRNLGFMQCSPSCTQIAPQRAANEEQSNVSHHQQHSFRRQQWHNRYQQCRAAQE